MVINQKADKQVGVAFGEELEETLAKAWDRVNNPPRLNIFVPVGEEVLEYSENIQWVLYEFRKGKQITKSQKPSQNNHYTINGITNHIDTMKNAGYVYSRDLSYYDDVSGYGNIPVMVYVYEENDYVFKFNLNEKENVGLRAVGKYEKNIYKMKIPGAVDDTGGSVYYNLPSTNEQIIVVINGIKEDYKGYYLKEENHSKKEVVFQKKELNISLNMAMMNSSVVDGYDFIEYAKDNLKTSATNVAVGYLFKGATYLDEKAAKKIFEPLGFTVSFSGKKAKITIKQLNNGQANATLREEIDLKYEMLNLTSIGEKYPARNISMENYKKPEKGVRGTITVKAPVYNISKAFLSHSFPQTDANLLHAKELNIDAAHQLYFNQNHVKYIGSKLGNSYYNNCLNATTIGGLYNPNYNFQFKVVELNDENIEVLEKEPKEIAAYKDVENLIKVIKKALGYATDAAGGIAAAVYTVADEVNDLLGLEKVAMEYFDPEHFSQNDIDNFAARYNVEGDDNALLFLNGGEADITNISYDIFGSWCLRVICVKNQASGEYVPCVCTYYNRANIRIQFDISYRVGKHRESDSIKYKQNPIIKSPKYVNSSIPLAEEMELAKIIFSQFEGRMIWWDHKGSKAKKTVVLSEVDGNTKKPYLTLENFEENNYNNTGCPFALTNF